MKGLDLIWEINNGIKNRGTANNLQGNWMGAKIGHDQRLNGLEIIKIMPSQVINIINLTEREDLKKRKEEITNPSQLAKPNWKDRPSGRPGLEKPKPQGEYINCRRVIR